VASRPEIRYEASPTCSEFHRDDSFIRGLMGPIGSGKSVACCWELWRRLHEQGKAEDGIRRSRWVIVRNTYRELTDTTLKTWRDWFAAVGEWRVGDMSYLIRHGEVEAEILFRALDRPDDVKKLLSLELTGAWVNEAREVPRGVIDMLQGRVGRYPSQRQGGPTWYGVIMDTNPPDTDHWWYVLFEEQRPDGWRLFRQPSALSEAAENLDNLPPAYYQRMLAGKTPEWTKVYVHGDYGMVSDGRPVFPEYRDTQHCTTHTIAPTAGEPLFVGIDFGLTPAAVILQQVAGQWRALAEVVTDDMGAVRFGELLKGVLQRDFKGYRIGAITGDPAGEGRSQVDERTPFDVLRVAGIDATPADTNDFTIRRETVAKHLQRLTMAGEPGLVISPACKILRKGLGGGYAYKRLQVAGDDKFRDYPDKGRYSHVADALQYALLGAGEGAALVMPTGAWRDYDPSRLAYSVA
jgi:hypothetical protein